MSERKVGGGATRRHMLSVAGGAAVAATATTIGAAEDKPAATAGEREFTGQSKAANFQEALEAALKTLSGALGDGGVADAQAAWRLGQVTGVTGGIAGQRTLKVTIKATRTPPWAGK